MEESKGPARGFSSRPPVPASYLQSLVLLRIGPERQGIGAKMQRAQLQENVHLGCLCLAHVKEVRLI